MQKRDGHNRERRSKAERVIEILLTGGHILPDSLEQIHRWLVEARNNDERSDLFLEKLLGALKFNANSQYASDMWPELALRLGIADTSAGPAPKIPIYRKVWFRAASAAAVAVLIGLGVSFSNIVHNETDTPEPAVVVSAVGERPHRVVETIEDVQKDVTLCDDTKVWVNGGSRMTYPEHFDGEARSVKLEGEAWFEVSRNEAQPFFVHTDKLQVKVLGTKFNVAEGVSSTVVTLSEGAVEVSVGERRAMLRPHERLTYDHVTGGLSIERIEMLYDWRTEEIVANEKTVAEILRMIGNYYDVEIVLDGSFPSERYSLDFNKREPVEHVLRALSEVSGSFRFRRDGDMISIINY